MRRSILGGAAALLVLAGARARGGAPAATAGPALGRPVSIDVVRAWDITVASDGAGLSPGEGSVAEGHVLYDAKCRSCHGPAGVGGIADRLTGGIGSLASDKPVKTVASYWPYAPTLFDYIRRAMPLTAPQSLGDRDVYSLVAYLLSIDGIVAADAALDASGLARIRMPNRTGFVSLARQHFDGNAEHATMARATGE
ncbi:c-type cytochrome [Sphingomonas sp.]|uniref:c-type cytochrome n=1 Tax=Sphingomonas sp. TaxID=28214 RepID=UPI003B3AE3FB